MKEITPRFGNGTQFSRILFQNPMTYTLFPGDDQVSRKSARLSRKSTVLSARMSKKIDAAGIKKDKGGKEGKNRPSFSKPTPLEKVGKCILLV